MKDGLAVPLVVAEGMPMTLSRTSVTELDLDMMANLRPVACCGVDRGSFYVGIAVMRKRTQFTFFVYYHVWIYN